MLRSSRVDNGISIIASGYFMIMKNLYPFDENDNLLKLLSIIFDYLDKLEFR